MGTAVRTVYIELRASAEKLRADMAEANSEVLTLGASGKAAGQQMATGMHQASVSVRKVAEVAAEGATALAAAHSALSGAVARYGATVAASGSATDALVNTYRGLRLALSPTPFTAATIAAGILTEEVIRLTNARARLIEQQSLVAATSGLSINSIQRTDAAARLGGGNTGSLAALSGALASRSGSASTLNGLAALGLSADDPELLAKIARGFASIEDPARRAAIAVQIFGADLAGQALQELNLSFSDADAAVQKFGLVLDSVSRQQIFTFRQDMLALKHEITDFSTLSGWWKSVKQGAEVIAAALEDMAKRGAKSLDDTIARLTHLKGAAAPLQTLPREASLGRTQDGLGAVADDLFAQAQVSAAAQSQTLSGRQSAQAADQAAADAAYKALADDQAKRQFDPHDPSLLTGQQRFSLATEQQSKSQLASIIGQQVKALQDKAQAEKDAAATAEEAARRSIAAAKEEYDQITEQYAMMYAESVKAANEITREWAQVQKENGRIFDDLGKGWPEAEARAARYYEEISKAQLSAAEIETKGDGAIAELQIQARKLGLERAYGQEVAHTGAQQVAYLRQVADLDQKSRQAKISGLQGDLSIAEESIEPSQIEKAAQLRAEIAALQQESDNASFEAQTKILATMDAQNHTLQANKQLAQALTDWSQINTGTFYQDAVQSALQLPGAISGSLVSGIFDRPRRGQSRGQAVAGAVAQSAEGVGKEIASNLLKQAIEKLITELIGQAAMTAILGTSQTANTTALAALTAAVAANTAAQGASGAAGLAGGIAGGAGAAAGAAASSAATGLTGPLIAAAGGVIGGVISGVMSLIGDAKIVNAVNKTTAAVYSLKGSGGPLLPGATNTLQSPSANSSASTAQSATTSNSAGVLGVLRSIFGFGSSGAVPVSIVSISPLSPLAGISHLFGFANGGDPGVGIPRIVGEHGPEIFTPHESGYITPNHKLGGLAFANRGGNTTHNYGDNHFHGDINLHGVNNPRDMARGLSDFLRSSSYSFAPAGSN